VVDIVIDSLSCQYIGANDGEPHRVLLEGLYVEDIVFVRDDMVTELSVEIVTTLQ
jgi:hypothetical protein